MDLNLGAVAFWLALGAWLVALALSPWLNQREVQRTIRAMIEKHGAIDAETLAGIRGAEEGDSSKSGDGKTSEADEEWGLPGLILWIGIIAGFILMSYLLSEKNAGWMGAVRGGGALVGFVTLGVLGAWLVDGDRKKQDPPP